MRFYLKIKKKCIKSEIPLAREIYVIFGCAVSSANYKQQREGIFRASCGAFVRDAKISQTELAARIRRRWIGYTSGGEQVLTRERERPRTKDEEGRWRRPNVAPTGCPCISLSLYYAILSKLAAPGIFCALLVDKVLSHILSALGWSRFLSIYSRRRLLQCEKNFLDKILYDVFFFYILINARHALRSY